MRVVVLIGVACLLCSSSVLGIECEEVFVGGGWAGVYAAYRRSLISSDSSKLCLFERSGRIGGRTYSIKVQPTVSKNDEFVIDVGAYRFTPDMHLPGDLILNHLKLPTECYEPACLPAGVDFPKPFLFNYSAPLRRIIDPTTGRTGGYVTAIDEMIKRMKSAGVQVFLHTELVDIKQDATVLEFKQGTSNAIITLQGNFKLVVLNLPRNFLLKLKSLSKQVSHRTMKTLECIKFDRPKSLFPVDFDTKPTSALSKAYVYYPDAWWITKINQTIGTYPSNAFQPIHTSSGIYIGVHWSDGPTVCNDAKTDCHGFLEVYYSVSNETFYADVTDNHSPAGQLRRHESQANANKLDTLHGALLEAINPLLKVSKSKLSSPEMLIVGSWHRPNAKFPYGQGYTAPTKVYYSPEISGSLGAACEVPGLTEIEYRDAVLQPFSNKNTFLVNNDWVALDVKYMFGDWAEESLLQAERALRLAGTPKAEWIDTEYYDKNVAAKVKQVMEETLSVDK